VHRKQQKYVWFFFTLFALFGASFLIIFTFKENLIYFYSPTDVYSKQIHIHDSSKIIRIGGLIEDGSIEIVENSVEFTISDNNHSLRVYYLGITPPLFREKQGIIAEGMFMKSEVINANNEAGNKRQQNSSDANLSGAGEGDMLKFYASKLITRHDENYMPKEIYDSLKQDY